MNNGVRTFLLILLFSLLLSLAIILLAFLQILNEKITYGESAIGFCNKNGGTYSDGVFKEAVCFIDNIKYSIYYNYDDETWRLAK